MSSCPTLPAEVIEIIIFYFRKDASYVPVDRYNSAEEEFLNQKYVMDLLKLRLLGQTWSNTVSSIVYKSLHLEFPWANKYLADILNSSINFISFSQLRNLTLDRILHQPDIGPGSFYQRITDPNLRQREIEFQYYDSKSISLQEAAKIITLSGLNLTHLKLKFTNSVGFSEEFVLAMKKIKSLKTLVIAGDTFHNPRNDAESLTAVLNNADELPSLSLDFGTLSSLDLKDGALSNLEHLWVACHPNNLDAISNFCESGDRPLKLLEFRHTNYAVDAARLMMALSGTLEGLFIDWLPACIPHVVRICDFPELAS